MSERDVFRFKYPLFSQKSFVSTVSRINMYLAAIRDLPRGLYKIFMRLYVTSVTRKYLR